MREAELLSRLVIAHELRPDDAMLRDEYFEIAFGDEWRFIKEYHTQFGSLPNAATFRTQFPDFPFEDTENTAQWLADEVKQEYLDQQLDKALIELRDRKEINPLEAAASLAELAQSFAPYLGDRIGQPVDLIATAPERLAEAERRRALGGLSGITTGFDLLDEVTGGTEGKDIEIYFARPAEGKTLVLLWGAWRAAVGGARVTFVSPEMDAFEMGLRLDAYSMHISAFKAKTGKLSDDELDNYREEVNALRERAQNWRGTLLFREPVHVGRRFNTSDLLEMIRIDRPRIMCIDGLLLVDPVKNDRDPRKRLMNLMDELKNIVVTTGVPMRIAHQANRQAAITKRQKPKVIDDLLPTLDQTAESASVEQYATGVVSIKRYGEYAYLALRKNRNGEPGRIIRVKHDIDRGYMNEFTLVDGDQELKKGGGGASENRGSNPEDQF